MRGRDGCASAKAGSKQGTESKIRRHQKPALIAPKEDIHIVLLAWTLLGLPKHYHAAYATSEALRCGPEIGRELWTM